jgi:hypothetical protein
LQGSFPRPDRISIGNQAEEPTAREFYYANRITLRNQANRVTVRNQAPASIAREFPRTTVLVWKHGKRTNCQGVLLKQQDYSAKPGSSANLVGDTRKEPIARQFSWNNRITLRNQAPAPIATEFPRTTG